MALQGFALFALSALALAGALLFAYKYNTQEEPSYGSGYSRTENEGGSRSSNHDSWAKPTKSERRRRRKQLRPVDVTCTICLQDITDIITWLPCDHAFHPTCIYDWRSQGPIDIQNTCPNCREKYNVIDVDVDAVTIG